MNLLYAGNGQIFQIVRHIKNKIKRIFVIAPSYTAGFYEANGGKLFVSRGLGNSGRTFRLFNRPALVILTLERE